MIPASGCQSRLRTGAMPTADWGGSSLRFRLLLPFHTNLMRARTCSLDRIANVAEIDPDFKDPYAVNPLSKRAREGCVAFLERKLGDPALVAAMTPPHPIWSARAVVVDTEYCVLDALLRDNVTLVTAGIERIEPRGSSPWTGRCTRQT